MDLLNKNFQLEHAPEQVMGEFEHVGQNLNNNNNNKNLENNDNKNVLSVSADYSENKKNKNLENYINKKYNKKVVNNLFPERFRTVFKCGHRCKLDVLTGDFHVPCGCPFYKGMRNNAFGYEYNVFRRRMEEMVKYYDEVFNRGNMIKNYNCDFLVAGYTLEYFPKYLCYNMDECLSYSAGMNFQAYTLLEQFDLYKGYTSLVVSTANVINTRENDELFFNEVRESYYRKKTDLLFYAADHKGDGCCCPIHFFKALLIYEIYVQVGVPINEKGRNLEFTIPIVEDFKHFNEIIETGGFEMMVKRLFEIDSFAHRYSAEWITSDVSKVETFMLANFFPSLTTDGVEGAVGQIGFKFRDYIDIQLIYDVMTTSLPVVFGHYLHLTFQGVLSPPKKVALNITLPCLICDSTECGGSCIWYDDGNVLCESAAYNPQIDLSLLDENSDSSDVEESSDDEHSSMEDDGSMPSKRTQSNENEESDDDHKDELDIISYECLVSYYSIQLSMKTCLEFPESQHNKLVKLSKWVEETNIPTEYHIQAEAEARAIHFDYDDDYHDDVGEVLPPVEYHGTFATGEDEHFDLSSAMQALSSNHEPVWEEGRGRVEFNQKKLEVEFKNFVKRMPREDYRLVFSMYKRDKKRIYTALPEARRIDMQNFLDWLHLHKFDKVKCESNLSNMLLTFGLEGSEFVIYGMTIFMAFYKKQWMFLFYEFMTNDYWTVADEHIRNVVIFLQNCFLGTSESVPQEFLCSVIIPILVSVGYTLEDFAHEIARLVGFSGDVVCESPLRENLLMEAFLKMVTVVSMSNYLKDLAPVEYLVAFVSKVKVMKTDAYEPVKVSFDFFRAFGECCIECYSEKSFMPLLRWDNLQAFTDDHIEWINSVKLSIKPTISWFEEKRAEGEELEKRCKKLMKKSAMSTLEYSKFSQALSIALYQLENRRKACEMAPQAYGVILRGPPGGGKTALGEGLHKMVAAMNGIDPSISLGQIKIDAKHQTNVLNHVVSLLFNDVDLAPKGDPQSWIATCESLRAGVDTAPFQTEQASLEDKENAFVKPQLTMVTTNSDLWYFGEISGEKFVRRYPLIAYVDRVDLTKDVSLDNMKITLEKMVVTGDGIKNKPCVGKFYKTGVSLSGEDFLEFFRAGFNKHHYLEKQNISKRNLAYQFCRLGASLGSHMKEGRKVRCSNSCNILDKDELDRYGRDKALDIVNSTECSTYNNAYSICSKSDCKHCTLRSSLDVKCDAGKYLLDHTMPCDDCKCNLNWEETDYCVYGKHVHKHDDFCGEYCHVYKPGLVCDCGMAWRAHYQQCDTTIFKCRYNNVRVKEMQPFMCNQGKLIHTEHGGRKCDPRCNFGNIDEISSNTIEVKPEGPREFVGGIVEKIRSTYRQRSGSYGLDTQSDEEEPDTKPCFNSYWWKHAFNSVFNLCGMVIVGLWYSMHAFLEKYITKLVLFLVPNKIALFFKTPHGKFLVKLGQGAVAVALLASIINKFRAPRDKNIAPPLLPPGHMGCQECDEKCDSIRSQHLAVLKKQDIMPVTEALKFSDNSERFLVYGVPQMDQIRKDGDIEFDKGVLNQPLLINNPRLATAVFDDVLNVIKASALDISCEGMELQGWVFNQSLIIFNTHFLPHFERSKLVAIKVRKTRKVIYYEYNVEDISVTQDLTFLKLGGLGNGIQPFLYPSFVNQQCSGRLIAPDFSYSQVVVRPDYRTQVNGMYAPTLFYGYVVPSEAGWCGRLLLLEIGSKWGIAGIHSHGSEQVPKVGLSTAVYPSLAPHVLFKSVDVTLDENITNEGIINVKSPLALFPDAVPLGNFNNAMVETPKIVKSELYELGASMLPEGLKYDFPKKKDCGKVDGVWKHGVKKKAQGVSLNSFHSTDLANMMINYTIDQINENAQPLPPGVALVGLEGLFKGMNPTTSNGPGYNHIKNKNDLIDDNGQVVEWFQDVLIERLKDYNVGKMRAWKTCFQRKSEVLTAEKIENYATRIFVVGELDLNVLAKMFIGPLNEIALRRFDVFRCAGKINATSKQWHFLHKEIMQHAYKLFADESGFDAKHKMAVFHVVALWMKRFAEKVGYNEKAAEIVYLICLNALHQIVQFKGDFIYIDYMLGSGFFLTLLLNSFVHLYLLWVAYAFIVARDIKRFFKEVCIALVGDDMAGSTSNEKFNLLEIAKVLKDLCGYTITSSIKGRELTPFSAPEEESFLKRTWRYDIEMDMYMGALYFGSVIKPIMFYEYNKEVSQAEKLAQTLDGLQRECFFHGREVFEKYARDPRIVEEYVRYHVRQFTYDELKEKFLSDNEYFHNWDQTLRLDGRETLNRCTQSVSPSSMITGCDNLQNPPALDEGYAISEEGPKAAPLLVDNVLTETYKSIDDTTITNEVIATTAFETSLQTLTAVPATHIRSGQFGDEYYQKILEKPVYIGTSSISSVVDSFEISDVMSAWMTHSTIAPLITRYAHFRGCPKITLVCNGSTYFFGRAIMGVDHKIKQAPNFGPQNFGGELFSVHQLCQLPHLEVDYSTSESYSIKVPWMSPNPFIWTSGPTFSQNYVQHHFYLMGINALACIDSTVVAPAMTFAVYISMEDIEFSIVTAEGPEELKKDGIVSAPLKAVSSLIKNIPSLPPNFTPYTQVADGLADLLSKIGLGKAPMLDVQPTTLISNPHFMNEDGRGAMHILANQTKQAKTLNVPAFASEDDMLIEKICNKWFFFKFMEPTSEMAVGAHVGNLKLGPNVCPSYTPNQYFPGPTNFVASMFDEWRGDYEVKIEIMGTTFHKGILTFTVDGSSSVTYANAINKSRVYTLDIAKERELIIQIPYRHLEPYLSLVNHDAFDSESEVAPYITHAVVNCWVTAPVSVGMGTGIQKVYVNYYVRTVNNDFQRPTMTKYQIGYGIVFEGPVWEEGPEPFIGSPTVALNNKIFGEKYSSLKQLTSMLAPYGFWVDSPEETKIAARRHPFVPLPPQYSTSHQNFYPDDYWWKPSADLGYVNGTYATIVPMAFFGQKGGYRYAVDNRFIHNGASNMYHQPVRNVDIELLWGANAATKGYLGTVENIFTSTMFPNYDKVIADNENGLSSFLVPDYHECDFRPANVIGLDYTVAANFDPNFQKYMAWSYKCPVLANNDNLATLYVAAADDNSCFSWRFVPRVSYLD